MAETIHNSSGNNASNGSQANSNRPPENANKNSNANSEKKHNIDEATKKFIAQSLGNLAVKQYELDNTNVNGLETRKEFIRQKELYENRGIFGIIADKFSKKENKRKSENGMERGIFRAVKNTFVYEFGLTRGFKKEKILKETIDKNHEIGVTEAHKKIADNLEKAKELGLDDGKTKIEKLDENSSNFNELKNLAVSGLEKINNASKKNKTRALKEAEEALNKYKKSVESAHAFNKNKSDSVDVETISKMFKDLAVYKNKVSMEAVKEHFDQKFEVNKYSIGDAFNTKDYKSLTDRVSATAATLIGAGAGTATVYALNKKVIGAVKSSVKAAIGVGAGAAIFGAYSGYKNAKNKITETSFNAELGEKLSKKDQKINVESRKISEILDGIKELKEYKSGDTYKNEDGKIETLDEAGAKKLNSENRQKRVELMVDAQARMLAGKKNRKAFLSYDSVEEAVKQKAELLDAMIGYESSLSNEGKLKFHSKISERLAFYNEEAKQVSVNRGKHIIKTAAVHAAIAGAAAGAFSYAWSEIKTGKNIFGIFNQGTNGQKAAASGAAAGYVTGTKPLSTADAMDKYNGGLKTSDSANATRNMGMFSEKSSSGTKNMGKITEEILGKEKEFKPAKIVSGEEFLEKAKNKFNFNGRSWEAKPTVNIGNWHSVTDAKGEFYELNLKSLKDGQNVNALDFVISTKDGKHFTFDIKDGKVRIPANESFGSTFFSRDKHGNVVFNGSFGEVGKKMKDGSFHVCSTARGTGNISKYVISENNKPSMGEVSERINNVKNSLGNPDSKIKDVGDIVMKNGKKIDIYNTTKGAVVGNPFFANGKQSVYNFGSSLYEKGASAEETAGKLFKNVVSSPEQTTVWAYVTGADKSLQNGPNIFANINSSANKLLGFGEEKYSDYVGGLNGQLNKLLAGGSVKYVDLNTSGYNRSLYEYLTSDGDVVIGNSKIGPNAGGLAIELLDKNGKNVFSGDMLERAKALLGVPPNESGRVLVRTDCGGQLIWVKDKLPKTPKIIDNTPEDPDVTDNDEKDDEVIERVEEDDEVIERNDDDEIIDDTPENPTPTPVVPEPDPEPTPEIPTTPTETLTPKNPEELISNQTPESGTVAPTLTEDLEKESPLTESPFEGINNNFNNSGYSPNFSGGQPSVTPSSDLDAGDESFENITENPFNSPYLDERNPDDIISPEDLNQK